MEHLLIVSDGKFTEHDVVPYVATEEYKTRSLADWLDNEWITKSVEFVRVASAEEINCTLQTWFFFGLFRQCLGNFFVDTDYIVQRLRQDGTLQAILTTEKLVPCLERWIKYARENPKSEEHVPFIKRSSGCCVTCTQHDYCPLSTGP